jgi:hypothetical protein
LHNAYKQTFTDKDNEGEQRVKYTTCNEWDWNQVRYKTRQNQRKMKRGSAMARKSATSTVERHPNKGRDQFRQKSWQHASFWVFLCTCKTLHVVFLLDVFTIL